jgi:GT2 family glycosyltransferase
MTNPAVALAGGPVAARWDPAVPQWIRGASERHPRLGAPIALLDYGSRAAELGPRTLLGANLAVRREAFTRVGGFPASLGKLRGTLLSGEDHELCRRVQAEGLCAMYLPDAIVYHWVPAHRAHASYFLRWFFWSGITHAIMDGGRATTNRRAVLGIPLYLLRQLSFASLGAAAGLLIANRTMALHRAIDVAFVAGYAAKRLGLVMRAEAATASVGEAA